MKERMGKPSDHERSEPEPKPKLETWQTIEIRTKSDQGGTHQGGVKSGGKRSRQAERYKMSSQSGQIRR